MDRKVREIKAKQRDALVGALIGKYEIDPGVVEATLPEVAHLLRNLVSRSLKRSGWDIFQLTAPEEEERWRSYRERVKKMEHGKASLSKEEAIEALEDAAALIEGSSKTSLELDRRDVVKLLKIATSLSLSKKGKTRRQVFKEGTPAKSISLLRGVQLHLTWDKNLLSVEVNPKELKLRHRALRFVGCSEDKVKDTAERHDSYLARGLSSV